MIFYLEKMSKPLYLNQSTNSKLYLIWLVQSTPQINIIAYGTEDYHVFYIKSEGKTYFNHDTDDEKFLMKFINKYWSIIKVSEMLICRLYKHHCKKIVSSDFMEELDNYEYSGAYSPISNVGSVNTWNSYISPFYPSNNLGQFYLNKEDKSHSK